MNLTYKICICKDEHQRQVAKTCLPLLGNCKCGMRSLITLQLMSLHPEVYGRARIVVKSLLN